MSLFTQIQSAATQAQSVLAQLGGMDAGAAGNFIGPDGQFYNLVFRAADAFEIQAGGREMTAHGYDDKSVLIATATRDQFTAPPTGWRRAKGTRLYPEPATDCLIATVSFDDPLHYVFTLLTRQTPAIGV